MRSARTLIHAVPLAGTGVLLAPAVLHCQNTQQDPPLGALAANKVGAVKNAASSAAVGAGLGVARGAASFGFWGARGAVGLGIGVARACVIAPAALLEISGYGPISKALRRADSAIADAHNSSSAVIIGAQRRTEVAMGGGSVDDQPTQEEQPSKEDDGGAGRTARRRITRSNTAFEGLGSFFLSDAAGISAAWNLIDDLTKPLREVGTLDLFIAARALAALQQAAIHSGEDSMFQEVNLPVDSERWLRYAIAVFGASRAQRMAEKTKATKPAQQAGRARSGTLRAASTAPDAQDFDQTKSTELGRRSQELEDILLSRFGLEEEVGGDNVAPADGSKFRIQEKAAFKAARGWLKEAMIAIRLQEREAVREAKARRDEILKAAKVEGKEALKAAQLRLESAAGRGEFALVCAGIPVDGVEVILFNEEEIPSPGEPHVPGHMVAIDHTKGCVVVAFRGSSCLRDWLLDLDWGPEPLSLGGKKGFAHCGMLRAAEKLHDPLADAVESALGRLPGQRRVIVVGHSLGAGVGSLLTALWRENFRLPFAEVRCLAFGCPQVLDSGLAISLREHVTSIIHGEDCVPCLGVATCLDLRSALILLASRDAHRSAADCDLLTEGPQEILAAARRNNAERLTAAYLALRSIIGLADGRQYPAGRLVKVEVGFAPVEVTHSVVDEVVVSTDMVADHLPGCYLTAIKDAADAGLAREPLWATSPLSK